MGTLYLIRHGQASYGEADYDRLSVRGQDQARAVGRWLATMKIDQIYSGPLKRQVQTVSYATEGASSLGVVLPPATQLPELAEYPAFEMLQHLVPRLVELDPTFEALTSAPTPRLLDEAFHTILAKWASDEWAVDGLERVSAFVSRVRAGLTRMLGGARSGARIACVTSAGPIGVAVGLTFGIPDARMVRTSIVIRNASVTELRFRTQAFARSAAWQPEEVSLVTFNLTGHLTDEQHTER
ncbi:MAG: putative phosphoglycerate mutase family protein [Myxococcales bacterium]|nr:putative phosphoglycerate mutase family protein [Myxococcales bacterium]